MPITSTCKQCTVFKFFLSSFRILDAAAVLVPLEITVYLQNYKHTQTYTRRSMSYTTYKHTRTCIQICDAIILNLYSQYGYMCTVNPCKLQYFLHCTIICIVRYELRHSKIILYSLRDSQIRLDLIKIFIDRLTLHAVYTVMGDVDSTNMH